MAERKRILVVDDDFIVRDVLSALLSGEGYDVRALASGEHVVALCRRWPPDCILLDMMMCPFDGWSVLRALRDAGLTPGLPVVVLSALGAATEDHTELEQMARRRGARGWAGKPFDWDTLRVLLEHIPPAADEGGD